MAGSGDDATGARCCKKWCGGNHDVVVPRRATNLSHVPRGKKIQHEDRDEKVNGRRTLDDCSTTRNQVCVITPLCDASGLLEFGNDG